MVDFHYEWWTVDVLETSGLITWEVKAKNKENAIRQIKKRVKEQNNNPYCGNVVDVKWNTLTLDRVGYQRLS